MPVGLEKLHQTLGSPV